MGFDVSIITWLTKDINFVPDATAMYVLEPPTVRGMFEALSPTPNASPLEVK